MMSRIFEHFPQDKRGKPCPLCGTRDDKPCVLIAIVGTQQENICECQPMHHECLADSSKYLYDRDLGIIYRRGKAGAR
jgi:hypothetical protein